MKCERQRCMLLTKVCHLGLKNQTTKHIKELTAVTASICVFLASQLEPGSKTDIAIKNSVHLQFTL